MGGSRTILDEKFAINSQYRVILTVFQVPISEKFPDAVKAKFVLIDAERNLPRLLVDNHEPFGFHMHTALPDDKDVRVGLSVVDYNAALAIFYEEVERILENEKK